MHEERSTRRARRAGRLVVGTAGVVAAAALAVAAARPWSMFFWPTAAWIALLAALATSVLVAGLAVRSDRRETQRLGPLFRGVVCFGVAAAIPWFAWIQPFKALWLLMYAGVAGGVFAALWWIAPAVARAVPPRARGVAAVAAFQLALVAIACEVALRALGLVFASPLLTAGHSPNAIFAQYRKEPGALHLGLRCDERGFNDVLVRASGTRLVACIGDSFSFGLVPRTFHYTTIAEELLDAVEIYNAGVIAAGPAEYLRILTDDVRALEPELVLVALFVGNDVEEASRFDTGWSWLAQVFDRESLRLWTVPQRLARIGAERRRSDGGGVVGAIQGDDATAMPDASAGALRQRFPWLDEPSRERASMSVATFVEVERRRAAFACSPENGAAYDPLFRALDALVTASAPTPIAFVLIPDEFQVEDALWTTIATPDLERDLPQRRIAQWLAARGLEVLDLLPVLRAEPPLADGDRHLYHQRDTHWNRRGNEVAGRALAAFLRTRLPD